MPLCFSGWFRKGCHNNVHRIERDFRTCALQRLRSWRQDDKLAAQLGSIKWGIDSRGRIKIESKDDMRKRGLPSPDRADAMAIAFAGKANAAPMNVESHAGESITGI